MCLLCGMLALTGVASAQTGASPALPTAPGDGPPGPLLPETIARDGQGRATMVAVRVAMPMRIDGRLDEAFYSSVRAASNFIQMEPQAGMEAAEKTEVWVSFDDANLCVSFRVWESEPGRMVATELRRDSNNIRQGDSVGFSSDTFRDRRNGFQFETNPLGARSDGQSTNERQFNADWNPVWRVAAGTFEGGWTSEAIIPFKSLRFAPGTSQVWGFQARRISKWKNEISYPYARAQRLRPRPRRLLGVALRHTGWPRGAEPRAHAGTEAVRDRGRGHRHRRAADSHE